MNLLLDTCAVLALAGGSLSKSTRKCLAEADDIIVNAIVGWEIAIKVQTGKLQLPMPPLPWLESLAERHSLTLDRRLPDLAVLCAAAALPSIHRDPFDRVIVATAIEFKLTILTCDRIIPTYPGVQTAW